MLSELLKNPKALAISVGLHVALIGLIVFEFAFSDRQILVQQAPVTKTVQTTISCRN